MERGILTEEEIDARMRELGRRPGDTGAAPGGSRVHQDRSGRSSRSSATPRDARSTTRSASRSATAWSRSGADADGHTRLPTYVRGLTGVVDSCDGAFVFPDTSAAGAGENPQWTYTVRFESDDVWGDVAEQRAPVYVGVWESYLEPAA